ncbi:hypothetical protein SH668x_000455 [Planctomicrobium sp. SH668]|uniref:hypothetical protein n=1 Tax=Planctomicrobium sp. SH668 TaxID=3448126 RepID=UPI003F5B79FD
MWPSETPWPVVIVSMIVAVFILIAWAQTRKSWLLVLLLFPLALSIGAFLYDQAVVTDREQVEANSVQIVREFQARRHKEMISYISNSARDIQLLASAAFNLVQLGPDTRITDVNVDVTNSGDRATSTFRVNTTLSSKAGDMRHSTMWEAKWQPESDGWKMIDIVPCDPITEKRQQIPQEWRRALNVMYSP